jgi:coenzyme F420-reducing hydrogenase alpha subunit
MSILQDFIAKIEGHGRLRVNWAQNKVQLEVEEGERLFEGMVCGRPATDLYWITPRICGVCPIAHNLAAIKAVEDALDIKVSWQTTLLRRLLLCAQIIQSHVLHLYFLALPDYLGLDSGTELLKTHPRYFADAQELKRISDLIADIVGGRGIHPTTTTAGGFHKVPTFSQLKKLKKEVQKAKEAASGTLNLFSSLNYPEIKHELLFLSQIDGKNYNTYASQFISSNKGLKVKIESYKKTIEERIKTYSTAKFGYHQGKGIMVGALARLAIQADLLIGEAKDFYHHQKPDFENPYENNLAQAIEVLYFATEAQNLVEEILEKGIDSAATNLPTNLKPKKKSRGIGAIEAPRGGLYYEIEVDTNGLVTEANIITPTVQNLSSIEESAQAVLDQTQGLKKERRQELLEMLVRAYDPCITCSVH